VVGSAFTYANGVSILVGNEGTYSNANVTAYLTARTTTISDGYLSTAGMTVTAGNLKTTSANIGGVIIESGGIGSLASLGVVGLATIGADLAVTGNITGGGLRKYAQTSAPANPVVGDVWYKTDTDVYYTYINDGTNKFWIDYVGATVSNASPTSMQNSQDQAFVSGTLSTSPVTGAVTVIGGVGVAGNINATQSGTFAGNVTAANLISNAAIRGTTLTATSDVTIGGNTAITGNLTAGSYFSAGGLSVTNGNLTATGQRAVVGGLTIENGGFGSLASLDVIGLATFGGNVNITQSVNVTKDIIATGNIVAGGVRKYAQTSAPANPIVGDVWYKTDTDVYYTYVNDGTNKYWIDYTSATVSNASSITAQSVSDLQITSGTASTNSTSGALQVVGGVGITGAINVGGNASIGNVSATTLSASRFTYANGVSILAGNEGTYSNANVLAYLAANGITATTAGINTTGNLTASGIYLAGGGITATSGVLTVGNIISSGTRAVVGG
jgi:hypothetical protein